MLLAIQALGNRPCSARRPEGSSLARTDTTVATHQAITCGLLANELVTNALKHACPGGREVLVSLQAVDNPANRGRAEGTRMCLARQLQSRLEVGPGPVAHFSVQFLPGPSPSRAPASTR